MQLFRYTKTIINDYLIKIISKIINNILAILPKRLRKEIYYQTPGSYFLSAEAKKIEKSGYLKLNLKKDALTYNAIKKVKKESLEIVRKLKFEDIKNKDISKDYLKVITPFFDKKDLFLIANDKFILQTVSSYFGFQPTIRTIDVWLNFPTKGDPKATQLFHRDYDDEKLLKLFIAISDINTQSGPFQFIEGSHKRRSFHEFKHSKKVGRISVELENKIINSFPNLFTFTGKLGDGCLVNTKGLHRGLKPEKKSRIMIAISFTSPNPNSPYVGIRDDS